MRRLSIHISHLAWYTIDRNPQADPPDGQAQRQPGANNAPPNEGEMTEIGRFELITEHVIERLTGREDVTRERGT